MSGKQRSTRKARSVVWNYFDKVPDELFQAKCKLCFQICQNVTNTSNLFYHLRLKHPEAFNEAERQREYEAQIYNELKIKAGRTPKPFKPRSPVAVSTGSGQCVKTELGAGASSSLTAKITYGKRKFGAGFAAPSSVDVSDAVVKWLAIDMLPPSTISTKGFKLFLSSCGLQKAMPTKKTLFDTLIPKCVEDNKVKVKYEMDKVSNVALSVENWLFQNTETYTTVTVHFISEDWVTKSYTIETFDTTEDRTDQFLASSLKRVSENWGIYPKVTVLVSDTQEEIISNAVIINGWQELSCFGQALNQVIELAITSVPELVIVQEKLSQAVAYFNRSPKASDSLASIQQQHNLPLSPIKQEDSGLWVSTLDAMECVVDQYEAINTVLCLVEHDEICLSDDDVDVIREIIALLKPFRAVVEELCIESYTSISKLIPVSNLLQQVTADSTGGQLHDVLKKRLLEEMQQRLGGLENKPLLAITTLLDPRFKQHAFSDSNALETAQDQLLQLTRDIIETSGSSVGNGVGNTSITVNNSTSSGTASSLWDMFDRKLQDAKAVETDVSEADNEVRRFFKEVNILRTANPFSWWRINAVQYPHLTILAKRFLCVPATAIPSERLFYNDKHLFETQRQNLRPTDLNDKLFLHQNIRACVS